MGIDISSPGLALWSIPMAYAVTLYPAARRVNLLKEKIGFNNVQPRANLGRLEKRIDLKADLDKAQRMEGAHQNGFESFPLWASAVIASKVAGLDNTLVNTCAIGYTLSRIVYNYIYINHTTEAVAKLRTLSWLTSLGFSLFLLVQSGRALNAV